MKISMRFPLMLVMVLSLVVFGCKKKKTTEVDPAAEITAKLSVSPWVSTAVTLDGEDRSADFANFQLTFTEGKTYTATGVDALYASVWPSSGTWDYKDSGGAIPDLTTMVRDGSLEISIDVITDTALELSFTFVTGSLEGTTSTEGLYIFSFSH